MKRIESILLIDDSDATNELNRYYFEEVGLHKNLIIKKNGKEALKFLQASEKAPQVIFLDVKMPVMDGFEFLDEYEKINDEIPENTKVVLLTTSSCVVDLKKAKEHNAIIDILMKPLDEEKINNVLQKLTA